jgi:hypothetical protein
MRRINWTLARFAVIALASFGAIAPAAQALAGVPGTVS